ncbi:hypothetical protein SUGI_0153770 [Cryptomeria japonica]|nr:hypothetical protein SUGI_0153770 [Cryptomeria japonica]
MRRRQLPCLSSRNMKDDNEILPAGNGLFVKAKRKRGRPNGKQSPLPKKDTHKELPKCFDSFKAAMDITH